MGRFHRAAAAALATATLFGCSTHLGFGAETSERCWPGFPYQDGWLGGDAAYSVPLSDSQTLWLFGDSFVGRPSQPDRTGSHFIHNSVAIGRCERGGRWSIRYFWGSREDGTPGAFLERNAEEGWWWLFDGFVHDDRLHLGLLEVEISEPRGLLSMPFQFTGMQLARIANYRSTPSRWKVELISLTGDLDALLPSAMVVEGPYLYIFAFLDRDAESYPRVLARLRLEDLERASESAGVAVEYLAGDGSWKPGFDVADARILMDDNATEMSVRFHPGTGLWLALYNYPDTPPEFPDAPPSGRVWLRTAHAIEGPWSERSLLFRIPELEPDFAGGTDPNTACYAAKEHPQFSGSNRLLFTYVCNLFAGPGQDEFAILRRLMANMEIYRPIPVSLPLPANLGDR